jgi:hypothetical protein
MLTTQNADTTSAGNIYIYENLAQKSKKRKHNSEKRMRFRDLDARIPNLIYVVVFDANHERNPCK